MASTQEIRRRIKSVKSTRQITKAMQMVAASKMRRAQDASIKARPYAQEALKLLKNLAGRSEESLHPLLARREVKRILMVMIASDKGLCGGYNAQAMRAGLKFLQNNKDKEVEVITVGKRAEQFFRRLDTKIVATFNDFPTYPTSMDTAPIAKIAMDGFAKSDYDQAVLVYTHFDSTLKQTPLTKIVLPLTIAGAIELLEEIVAEAAESEYLFEPKVDEVLEYILPMLTEIQFYHAVLESIASEQSARMMAMKSATDNATDLVDDLTLTYNSMRQASITQELAEVSAGTEALRKQ